MFKNIFGSVVLLSCICYVVSSRFYLNPRTTHSFCQSEIFPTPPCCGFARPGTFRIADGTKSLRNEFPWMAYLDDCGGSLINSQWVLSAAHCLENFTQKVLTLGGHLCQDNYCEPSAKRIEIKKVFLHKKWKNMPSNAYDDIALAHLKEPVTFSGTIKPICLPFEMAKSFKGKHAIVAGWGYDEGNNEYVHLMKASVKIWSAQRCKKFKRWKQIKLSSKYQICAGGGSQSSCGGDSGGPLFLRLPSGNDTYTHEPYYQIGIVSFGTRVCAKHGYPQVYTNIANYLKWIKTTITKNQDRVEF